jgi:GT2 family glycosyltransferase
MSPCVLLLNWNGWQDTIECLESLLRSEGRTGPAIVCDNDSQDGSLEHIRAWAEGRLEHWLPPDHPLRPLTHPPIPKPIRYVELDRETAEAGGGREVGDAALVLIRTGDNLGFAGGINVGLRYVLTRPELDCVWILNNDTVVRSDALTNLVSVLEADPTLGICGSTLLYYDAPGMVQARGGGSYNRWLALPKHLDANGAASGGCTVEEIQQELAFVVGASMLVRRSFLETVGLLSEDYFLYFEELDWALRAGRRFRLGYAAASVVYHKEGRSIGTAGMDRKSWTSDYYFLRNRLLLTRRFFPRQLPTVYLALFISMLRRIRRNQWDRVRLIFDLWRKS